MIHALPKSYGQLGSVILATAADVKKLEPSMIRPKVVEEEARRKANNVQVAKVSKAPQVRKYCDKCKKETNHTTENHWEKGQRPQQTPQASGSGNQGGNQPAQQGQQGGGKRPRQG